MLYVRIKWYDETMISYLIGKPIVNSHSVLLLVNNVGYGVHVGDLCREHMRNKDEVALHIHTHVREDEISLYGFLEENQLSLFELLLKVSGVGPRSALAITDRGVSAITNAVQQADTVFFTSIPRIGKKLAQKIIIELKSKLGSLKELNLAEETPQRLEIIEALQSLKFGEADIQAVLQEIEIETISTEQAITQALKLIGNKK